MFIQFAGLSLLVHLIVILSAKLVNRVLAKGNHSAYQSLDKVGGAPTSQWVNIGLSYAIISFVITYMLILASVAIVTAVKVGAHERADLLLDFSQCVLLVWF